MSARIATFLIIGGLTVGCTGNLSGDTARSAEDRSPGTAAHAIGGAGVHASSTIASLPDRGSLLAYAHEGVVRKGATAWHPVQVSEAHALRAVAKGELNLARPDGSSVPLKYERHVVHANGNWSWIGHAPGAEGGSTVLTFGEKAVFGTVSQGKGRELQLTTAAGRTWMVETDPAMQTLAQQTEPRAEDFLLPPDRTSAASVRKRSAASTANRAERTPMAAGASQTVDVVLGYTSGFATRLGGTAQAETRLTHLVEIANQAYADSQVEGRIRLVGTVQVDYSDTTSNRQALFDLTGVSCTASNAGSVRIPELGMNCQPSERPAGLDALLQAREEFGADLVSLVRPFNSPEHGSCGTAWLLGAGQSPITAEDAEFAFSVVSDTSGNQFPDEGTACREEYLAHELGHNMGLQHDRATAAGSTDDTNNDGDMLDPEEYGALPYTFGHVAGVDAGNFYTIMSLRRAGATGYRVFSNPRITTCGGNPCGVADQADNARGMAITMPLVASFRALVVPLGVPQHDFNGDGVSDIFWRNSTDGRNLLWLSADVNSQSALTQTNPTWRVAGTGDFDGDGVSDVFWRNSNDGRNVIWLSGNSAAVQAVAPVNSQAWQVVGVGDFDADGMSDVVWRNSADGRNVIWPAADLNRQVTLPRVDNQAWKVAGVGDFNGDGESDLLWRNGQDGRNTLWLSGDAATQLALTSASAAWQVAATGDFNGDGKSDVFWRNSDGRNLVWLSADAATQQAAATIPSAAWKVVATGDYNADGAADLLWRNSSDGRNTIWLSADVTTEQAVSAVNSQAWSIVK